MQKYYSYIIFVFVLAFSGTKIHARSWQINRVEESSDKIVLHFKLLDYSFRQVETDSGTASKIIVDKSAKNLKKGAPDLPKIARSFILPEQSVANVKVLKTNYKDIADILIAPSKGNLKRTIDPSSVPYWFGREYLLNKHYPKNNADLGKPYIFRDYHGQTINIYPFAYNPGQRTLRVYSDILIEINFERSTQTVQQKKLKNANPAAEFSPIYSRHFINYKQHKAYTPLAENGRMLIIAHPDFMATMNDFVQWKIQKGIEVEMVSINDVGADAGTIKNYVKNYYQTKGLTFLLFVGDYEHIPASYDLGDSDSDYGHISGDDSYAEVIVGRFSGEDVADIQTQVLRVLNYEKTPLATDWMQKYTLIASEEGPGDDNEMDHEHLQTIKTDLEAYTYTGGDEFYEGTQVGSDASGDPTATMLKNAINDGRGVMVYAGHGDLDVLVTTNFDIGDINKLTNTDKLPFFFDVACQNGNFNNKTCFAEAFMRATYNNQPTGGIAIIASTIDQAWEPPMAGQDEMVDLLTEQYPGNIKHTFGGITINGCMKVLDDYPSEGVETVNTWTIFGDPSLEVRTLIPTQITATHTGNLIIGSTQLAVSSPDNGALACLSVNGEIISKQTITGGIATLSFDALMEVNNLDLIISAYNKTPYITQIPVIAGDGVFISLTEYLFDDEVGNNNDSMNIDENASISVSLKNIGNENAQDVQLKLTSDCPYVSIVKDTAFITSLNSDTDVALFDTFLVAFADSIPNEFDAEFNLKMIDKDENIWNYILKTTVYASELAISYLKIDDSAGNNNSIAEPGETVDLIFNLKNTGGFEADDINCAIVTENAYLDFSQSDYQITKIGADNTYKLSIAVSVDNAVPNNEKATVVLTTTHGKYSVENEFIITLNSIIEDWESNSFTKFYWKNDIEEPWTLSSSNQYEGTYSAQSAEITNDETSTLSIKVFVLEDDTISFYKKLSCEDGYDYFDFYIDDELIQSWTGEIDWSYEKFFVKKGLHTFTWSYVKDDMMSEGDDCAWLDYIKFPKIDLTGNEYPEMITDNFVSAPKNEEVIHKIEFSDPDDNVLTISSVQMPAWLTLTQTENGKATLSGTPTGFDICKNKAVISVSDGYVDIEETIYFLISPEVIDWDNTGFDYKDWSFAGSADWVKNDTQKYDGTYSAKSGTISHSDSSVMKLEIDFKCDDIISFVYKVSSEESYDFFNFYIDDELYLYESGDVDWQLASFKVLEGTHEFKWVYVKDDLENGGDDCVWVDSLTIPSRVKVLPEFISEPILDAIENENYFYKIKTNKNQSINDFVIEAPKLPSWLSITDNNDGTAVLSGMPQNADIGAHIIKLSVNDSENDIVYQDFILNVSIETGIEINENKLIYNNPVQDNLKITSTQIVDRYEIKDLYGRVLAAGKTNATSFNVNTQVFSNGFYFMTIYSGKEIKNIKFVVKK